MLILRFSQTTKIYGKPVYETYDINTGKRHFGLRFVDVVKFANEAAIQYLEDHPSN